MVRITLVKTKRRGIEKIILGNESEDNKLKKSYLPKYTKTNLLFKSLKISLLNWKIGNIVYLQEQRVFFLIY